MKLRSLSVLSLTAVVAGGCDAPSSSSARSCDVVVPAFRGVSINGANLNGLSLNGTSFNGLRINGMAVNSTSFNGLSLNGVSINGARLGADVRLVGTRLQGRGGDGAPIVGAGWLGAIVQARIGDERVPLRIAAVEQDDDGLEWYALELGGVPLCGEAGRGLFLAGVWDETGARHDALAGDPELAYSFSCDTGALAKCVAWGYAPEQVGADAHQSCTRMVRADYCGSGEPHTVDGTLIDVFDTLGVQRSDTSIDLAFEAGWGPNGAVCVSRSRYTEVGSDGDEIAIPCWDELAACDSADEAIAAGAQLLDRSAELTLCHA